MVDSVLDERTKHRLSRALTWVLLIALVLAIIGVIYVAMTPGADEDTYTEFYILGSEGEAADYPTNLTVGETGEVIVGVTNNEQRQMTYTVVFATDEEVLEERTITVDDGATVEERVGFSFQSPGERRIAILLFIGNDPESIDDPYRELQLVTQVHEHPSVSKTGDNVSDDESIVDEADNEEDERGGEKEVDEEENGMNTPPQNEEGDNATGELELREPQETETADTDNEDNEEETEESNEE